jgi:hypothetical protein
VRSTSVRSKRQVADKEAYTVHTINIISQRQYFVAHCLSSCVGNVFGYMCLFLLYPEGSDVDETHSLVLGTVPHCSSRQR